jgi:hypothetical protein
VSGVVCVVCPFADDEKLKNIHVDLALLVVFYTTVFLLPLSATHGAVMGYMELGSCYL